MMSGIPVRAAEHRGCASGREPGRFLAPVIVLPMRTFGQTGELVWSWYKSNH